jgi:hypothetical protein
MFSLFRLVFKSHYWRMLLRRATWLEASLSFKRAHKDNRARKHLLGLVILLLVPLLCVVYLAWLARSGAWLFIPFLLPILWWRARSAKRDDVPVHIAPTPEPVTKDLTEEERAAMRRYLAELTLIHAVMVDRAGSERFLKEKELPEGIEVTSRRTHLDLLKARNLWERLAREDREAIMMPDGHWDWTRINQVALAMERLRLLRWILRIDFYLPLVGQQLKGDFTVAHELVKEPQKVLGGNKLADLTMMQTGKEAAEHYFQRCLAEAISRGYYSPDDEEMVERARKLSASMAGRQSDDLVLGSALVSEASKDHLMWATSLSYRRCSFLGWTISLLEAGEPPDPPFASVVEE